MTYRNLRFIAYAISTMPKQNADGSTTCLGLTTGCPPATSPADIACRVQLMLSAMETAAAHIESASPPPASDTLNVFMAPQFFFRGPMGAYQMAEVQQVIAQLRAATADTRWNDWLFGFGSILGTTSPPESVGTGSDAAYNFTLIQLGGADDTGGIGTNVVMKELLAGKSLIADTGIPGTELIGNIQYLPVDTPGSGPEQRQLAYEGAGVFEQAGITWSVEICLDQYNNPAGAGRLQRAQQLPGAQQVQVQLVPSGLDNINDSQVMAMPGGYVFNCDGANIASATLKQVDAAGKLRTLPQSAIVAVVPPPMTDGASPPNPVTVAQLYATGAGQIIFYDPVGIPAPATAAGNVRPLYWPATPEYGFEFQLIYGVDGQFMNAIGKIHSRRLNFMDYGYFLPMSLATSERTGGAVKVAMYLRPGMMGYSYAIFCVIDTPSFQFEGNVLLFNDRFELDSCLTIW